MRKSLIAVIAIPILLIGIYSVSAIIEASKPFNDLTNTSKDPRVSYDRIFTYTVDNSMDIEFEFGPKDPSQELGEEGNYTRSDFAFFLTFKNNTSGFTSLDNTAFDVIFKNEGKEFDRLSKVHGNKPFVTDSGKAGFSYDFPLPPGIYPVSFDIILYDKEDRIKNTVATIEGMELTVKSD